MGRYCINFFHLDITLKLWLKGAWALIFRIALNFSQGAENLTFLTRIYNFLYLKNKAQFFLTISVKISISAIFHI